MTVHDHLAAIPLADGGVLPSLGLGTWKIATPLAPEIVREAVRTGWRHFDCACDYGNERAVGAGLAAAMAEGLCQREEIWVTSKLWNTYHEPEHVRKACERSLGDLRLDVLDLYLVHFPIALAFVPMETRYPPEWFYDPKAPNPAMKPIRVPLADTWGAMEELLRAGLVKRIGVCNLGTSMLRDLLSYATVRPAVLQVEMHPYLTQQRLLRYCREERIAVTAFSPLGADSYVPIGMARAEESVLLDPVVTDLARRHGRTPAQIVLRWGVQRGTAVIPKTQQPARLQENRGIYDFELTDVEMRQIDSLDRNRRFNDPGEFCQRAFNTYYPIFD
jgi:D-xylose reductase